jgi:hypothetical protein
MANETAIIRDQEDNDREVLTGSALADTLLAAKANADYQKAVAQVHDMGFATKNPEATAFRATDGTTLILSFFESTTAPETSAVLVAHEVEADGSARTIAEEITRDASTLSTAEAVGLDAVTVKRIISSGPQTEKNAAAYFACMFGCIGVQCAGPATNCMRIPVLAAALTCIAGICGFRAYRCHRPCRSAW